MKELLSSPEFVRSGIILIFTALPILINCTNLGCEDPARVIRFPEPGTEGGMSVERAISSRRSEREYENGGLTLFELSQVLWAAQGITHPGGYRASPSAGALYPLEVYIAVGNVESLGAGIYKYKPHGHELLRMSEGDNRAALSGAALGQGCVKNAPAVVIIVAVYERTTRKYGQRGVNYVHYEAGHVAQNISLQAVALNLGTVDIGAFQDSEVKRIMNLADDEEPLIIMPLGRRSH